MGAEPRSPAAGTAYAATSDDATASGAQAQATAPSESAPASPTAKICGSSRLRGPSTRPKGSVRVSTTANLASVVSNKPAGTTFWLTPGVHSIGGGAYDSVEPQNHDRFVGAPGAIISGRHTNLYAFVGHAKDVSIEYLTIEDFGRPGDNNNEGVVNHDSASYWTIRWTTIQDNAGAGTMIGSHNVLSHDCLKDNGQYGFNAYSDSGVGYVSLIANEISGNNTDNWEVREPGCGCTGGGKFWDTRHARIVGNYLHGNHGVALWADTNNRDFLIEDNYFSSNDDAGVMYEISYNVRIVHNTFVRNAIVDGPENPGFPTGAIYLSESGSDPRVKGAYGAKTVIAGNTFTDNWSGIVLWENADRFAGSPDNSSSGVTTLVAPKVATLKACSTPSLIRKKPYVDDCRWKTQNVSVSYNSFRFTPSHIGSRCTVANACGFNGIFSNYGSDPAWSPYKGTVVEKHITFSQHNKFSHNTYVGPWRFVILEVGHVVSWNTWRSAAYAQDPASTRS